MYARELIGKKAIRTTHVTYAHGNISRSFMQEPIIIQKVTDTHIVYTYPEGDICLSDKLHILPYEYCDDNWIDYDELITIDSNKGCSWCDEFKGISLRGFTTHGCISTIVNFCPHCGKDLR